MSGNPDIVAPREDGFTLEPGWYGHEIIRQTDVKPQFFGKPFDNIYAQALERVGPNVPLDRIVMVGDTLHTDVWEALALGLKLC